MRDVVTKYLRLSLAGHKHRISPDIFIVVSKFMQHKDKISSNFNANAMQ